MAQNYANTCTMSFNENRVSQQSTFASVGENLFFFTDAVNYTDALMSWYSEESSYDYAANSCTAVCGNYAQVLHSGSKVLQSMWYILY